MSSHPLLATESIGIEHRTLGICSVTFHHWTPSMSARLVSLESDLGALACYVNPEGLMMSAVSCPAIGGAAWERLDPRLDAEQIAQLGGAIGSAFVAMTLGRPRASA